MKMKTFLKVFLLAFLPRAFYLFLHWKYKGLIIDDMPRTYWHIATSILHGAGFSLDGKATTYVEPFYPILLAFLRFISADNYWFVLFIQIAVYSLGNVLFYKLVLSFTSNPRTAWIASVLYAFYPYAIRRSLKIGVTFLLVPLLIGAIYTIRKAANPRYALLSGVAFGFILITRSMLLPFVGIASLFLLVKKYYRQWLLFTGTVLIIMTPMMIHNYRVDQAILPTRSGINLFIANCEFTDLLRPEYHLDLLVPYAQELARKEMPDYEHKSPKEIDRFFADKAWDFVKKNPGRILQLKIENLIYFFCPWVVPFYSLADGHVEINGTEGRIVPNNLNQPWRQTYWVMIHAAAYGFILITALAGMFLRRSFLFREDLPMTGLLLYFAALYSLFYWTSTRLETPVIFVLIFYSSAGINSLIEFSQKYRVTVKNKISLGENFDVNRISCIRA